MGESPEQEQIIDKTKSSLRVLQRERGWTRTHVAGDQFFAWIREEPLVRVSPDVYSLDDPPAPPFPRSWKTWKPGQLPPRFAVEVVSGDDRKRGRWSKDYHDAPEKYGQLGTRELVVFDPDVLLGLAPEPGRVALQLFRREGDGSFVRVYSGNGPARSEEVDAWLVARLEEAAPRLRLARDELGAEIVPTEGELLVEKDKVLAEKDAAIAKKDETIAKKDEAIAALREELDRLRHRS